MVAASELLDLPGITISGSTTCAVRDQSFVELEGMGTAHPAGPPAGFHPRGRHLPSLWFHASPLAYPCRLRLRLQRFTTPTGEVTPPPPGFSGEWRMSLGAIAYVVRQCLRHPVAQVVAETPFPRDCVREIARLAFARINASWPIELTPVLAVDGVYIGPKNGKVRGVTVSDPLAPCLVDFVLTHDETDFAAWLAGRPDRARVKTVVTDGSDALAVAVAAALPHARHEADPAHLRRLAIKKVQAVRRQEGVRWGDFAARDPENDAPAKAKCGTLASQLECRWTKVRDKRRLERVFAAHPRLGLAYALKEALCAVFEIHDPDLAQACLEAWCDSVPAEIHAAFDGLIGELRRPMARNHLDGTRLTSNSAESYNRRAKALYGASNGAVPLDHLRARLLARHATAPEGWFDALVEWVMTQPRPRRAPRDKKGEA